MSNVVPATAGLGGALPAHLRKPAGALANLNEEARVPVGVPQPPRISTRGKVFRLVLDGVEKPLTQPNEDGDRVPVAGLNMVVVGSNKGKYKTYFGDRKYNDDESSPPICYSFDGETPSPLAEDPQSASCATCKHNVFGSKITDQGNKTRACSDNKLIAVIEAGGVKNELDPSTMQGRAYRLKIPTTGLNRSREDRKKNPNLRDTSWMEYLEFLNHYPEGSVSVSYVVTRITFDNDSDYPLPRFRAMRFLTEEEVAFVEKRAQDPDVIEAVSEVIPDGAKPRTPAVAAPPPAQQARIAPPSKKEEDEGASFAEDTPPPKAVKPPKAAAKAKPAADDDASFGDDPAPAKAAKPAKQPKAAEAPSSREVVSDNDVAEIEAFFGN